MNGKKIVREIYYLEMAVQSFVNLALPIGIFAFLSWLLVEKKGAPAWVYAPLILFGTFVGLFSMVKFLLSASRQIGALEKQHETAEAVTKENTEERNQKERKQS